MTHINITHLHEFFKNKELNELYLAVALTTIGEALIAIFVPIYLYRLGYSIPMILFFFLMKSTWFFILGFFGSKIVGKMGVKHSMMFAIPPIIVYYLCLTGLTGSNQYTLLFFIAPFMFSTSKVLYNFSYHLNFLEHSDKKNRGLLFSMLGIITIIASLAAPLIGGIIAERSFTILYGIGIFFIIVSAIPLLMTKDKKEEVTFSFKELMEAIFSKKDRRNFISFTGYAIDSSIGGIVWPLFLIIIIGSLIKTGLIVMFSSMLAMIIFYAAGAITDRFDRIKIIRLATILQMFAWTGRIFVDNPLKIFLIDSYRNVSEKLLHVSWSAQGYDLAVKKGHFKFIVAREMTYAFARMIVQPILILVFIYASHPFIVSFIIAGIFTIGYVFIEK